MSEGISRRLGWRWFTALGLFGLAMLGQGLGVELSERAGGSSDWLTRAYYSLGLFVVGGLDVGMPIGGPVIGRVCLWVAYFGAPLLMASAVIEAVLRVVSPQNWQLRRMRGHVIVAGASPLSRYYLQVLRAKDPRVPVVLVTENPDEPLVLDIAQSFQAVVIAGSINGDFLVQNLRISKARRILLFGDNDYRSFEAAARMIARRPEVADKIVLHCHNLRFLRSMQETELVQRITSFNAYHLAAAGLVRQHLLGHLKKTAERDVVVLAGFGRFGQTILEELQNRAAGEMATVAVIDKDAKRRVLVVDEQERIEASYHREIVEGDIADPEVWHRLGRSVDLSKGEPIIVLGTGDTAQNLRAGIWIKKNYPNAVVHVRTNGKSHLAAEVGKEYGINSISMTALVEQHMPSEWLV